VRTINSLLQSALKVNLPYEIELSLIESSEDFVRLQKEQLSVGEKSDGQNIFNVKTGSDQYSPAYAKKKGKSSPIDLHDKGDFYGGIFLDVRADEMIVDSADSKSGMLQERYSDKVFGLADDRKAVFAPIAASHLVSNIQKELNRT
jgi:hypothetical protein